MKEDDRQPSHFETSPLGLNSSARHQARNLLNAIGLILQVLQRQVAADKPIDIELIQRGEESLGQLAQLIDGSPASAVDEQKTVAAPEMDWRQAGRRPSD